MRIAVIGAGAIGCLVAGYLAKAGERVLLVARKEQAQVIEKGGLHITGVRGEENIKLPVANRLNQNHDLVIFTVKPQDIEKAYEENHRYLEEGFILTTQNGVQADNLLSIHFDKENMFSSIVMFGATYIKPGEATFNFEGDWIVGKPYGPSDPNTQKIAQILKTAFPVVISDDVMGMKWLKLFVNFNNCLPALIGKSMQETFSDLDLCRLSILLLKEGVDVVTKSGVELVSLPQFPKDRIFGLTAMPVNQAAAIINKTLTSLSKEPLYGSILQSIMRKKTSEIDYINGEVVVLSKNIGLKAPLNRKIVELVHEVENTGRFFDKERIKNEFQLSAISSQALS